MAVGRNRKSGADIYAKRRLKNTIKQPFSELPYTLVRPWTNLGPRKVVPWSDQGYSTVGPKLYHTLHINTAKCIYISA